MKTSVRLLTLFTLVAGGVFLAGCGGAVNSQPRPEPGVGFWFWSGSHVDPQAQSVPVDTLYLHVGQICCDVSAALDTYLPDHLPPAREYWLVVRHEGQGVPFRVDAPMVARKTSVVLLEAQRRGLPVAGVQFDVDSPTSRLPDYAGFLREVRNGLPAGFRISITALIDWFRDGTRIDEVIREVDEFVPQFYDLRLFSTTPSTQIAEIIDVDQWGKAFARFQKPYRIGISTFGRARVIPPEPRDRPYENFSSDVKPLDVAVNRAFRLNSARNRAMELELNYRAIRDTEIGYQTILRNSTLQFVLATPEMIRENVNRARRMPGRFNGVVFFRWPSKSETLAMTPDEVLAILRAGAAPPASARLNTVDEECVAVSCTDMELIAMGTLSPDTIRYRIRSSIEFEYFLPAEGMPIRLAGPAELEVSIPPYSGRGRLHLGRAVTASKAQFTLEQQ